MKTFRKMFALVLSIIVILCTVPTVAFAAEDTAESDNLTITEDQINSTRFEDVKVDGLLMLELDAVIAIETYVSTDELGYYYVKDETSLRSVLTDDEYKLVLEQITITNNPDRLIEAGDGSEDNPYILTAGQAFPTSASSASSTWFRINDIRGAVDFKVTTSISASAVFYKKTLLGKTSIGSASGTYIDHTISSSSINNNSNNYIINVAVSSAMTSSLTVKQHIDVTTTYYSRGTLWTPDNTSAIPNTNLITMKMWYLDAEDVEELVSFVTHDNYLQFCDQFAAGLITAAGIATTIWGSGTYAKIVGVALALISLETPSLFKQHVLDSIDEAAGWNGYIYTNDIYMEQLFTNALYFTYVYSWTGSSIYGAPGYTGTFSQPPIQPSA